MLVQWEIGSSYNELNFNGLSPIHLSIPSICADPDLIKNDVPHATYVKLLLSCLVWETVTAD